MTKFAIIIPCYNEEKSVVDTIKALEYTIQKDFNDISSATTECDIYVYDNNSKDKTVEKVKEYILESHNENIKIVSAPAQGKGNVIKQAFQEIDADCYAMIDGDNTYGTENLKKMYENIVVLGEDMVIGDRLSTSYFEENKRPFHNLGNKVVKVATNILYHAHYKDALSGFRVFSKNFVKQIDIKSQGFTIETELNIFAAKKQFIVSHEKTNYQDRVEGSISKLNTYSDGIKILLFLLSSKFTK